MSEHLTHIAIYEDCARIILNTDRFCNAFRDCVKNHYDSGLLTSGTRGNHLFAIPILESYKDRWDEVRSDAEACQQISGAIGWITHRAADLQMKPTWRAKLDEDPSFPDSEMQVYDDAVTFREVYSGGKVTTGSPFELLTPHTLEKNMDTHPASAVLDQEKVEELVSVLFQKEFVELHQFHMSQSDMGKWMDDFMEYHQEFTEDLRMYIEAFSNPDPEKMDLYIHRINYYNPQDPIIQWVRSVQHGKVFSGIDLDDALEQATNQSQYAQALHKGYLFLSSASEYFMNRMDKLKLIDILDI